MSTLKVGKPFYYSPPGWTAIGGCNSPRGWYQWQRGGLVYLGESMLDEDTFMKQEIFGAEEVRSTHIN